MLYTCRAGVLWYFDKDGNLSHKFGSRNGVRQCCVVVGLFIFCVTMAPISRVLIFELGPAGMLIVAFSDDVYLHGPPVRVALAIFVASPIYMKVGLRIGWGPKKSELALSIGIYVDSLPLPRIPNEEILPRLVEGLEACLRIPRHREI